MKKRLIFILFITILTISFSSAQDKKSAAVAYGDKYFAVEEYYSAAEYYKKELEANPENAYAVFQLAECFRYFFDYDKAEIWYKKADELAGDKYPLAAYYHALMMKINGKYQPAVEKFEFFIATYAPQGSNDEFLKTANLHYNGAILALDALKRPQRDYTFHNPGAPVNTEFSEFSPMIWENDTSIQIASGRVTEETKDVYGRTGEAFLDLYRLRLKEGKVWSLVPDEKTNNDFKVFNSKFNDTPGCFSKDTSKHYFTRCDVKIQGDQLGCAIYVSQRINKEWQEPSKLNSNVNTGVWNAHPSLSTTDDTLFFSSKREGGMGMTDIWYTVTEESGEDKWQEAINMGPDVNSELTDQSPNFYSDGNVLFYSSNGKEGFGGLDIFMAKGENFSIIRNIGLPFNSNRDDFYMVLGQEKGYLSSNRDGGLGNDDIYMFNIMSKEALIAEIETDTIDAQSITIRGRIIDENQIPIPDVKVMLVNQENDEVLKTTYTDQDGVFVFSNLDPALDYRVVLDDDAARNLITEINYHVDDLEIIASNEKLITNVAPKKIEKEEKVVVDKPVEEEPVEEKPTTIKDLDKLVAADKPFRVLFENIYFDFNKYNIRPEGKAVLNDLAKYAKSNNNIKIELTAHTDNIGSNDYNYQLGQKRGKSAYDYLINKGVAKSSIVINSAGENKPLAPNANEIGRQLNRRVEFHVSGGNTSHESEGMVYVVPERTSLEKVAEQFNMSVSELKDMNNLTASELAAFKPVRVRRTMNDDIISAKTLSHSSASGVSANPYFNREEALASNRKTIEVATSGYNAGVKYFEYDGSGYYIVLPKNTLFSIAKITGTTVDQLMALNNIQGDNIYPGQRLRVSKNASASSSFYNTSGAMVDAGVSLSDQQGQIVDIGDGKRYVVKEGDNFYTVAKEFDMSFEELRIVNGLPDYILKLGMVLKVKDENALSNENNDEDSEEAVEEQEEEADDF